MISLIKGGAFDEMEDRKFTMAWYIWETCDKKSRITFVIRHSFGDPTGNRTPVTAVKGRCLARLTMGPK